MIFSQYIARASLLTTGRCIRSTALEAAVNRRLCLPDIRSLTAQANPSSAGSREKEKTRAIAIRAAAAAPFVAAFVFYLASPSPDDERRRAETEFPSATRHLARLGVPARPGWEVRCSLEGFPFAAYPGVLWPASPLLYSEDSARDPYWNEAATYQVRPEGMWQIEKASYEIHSMCLEAVNEVAESDELLRKFGIPEELWPAVRFSWRSRQTDLAGRLDLLWDGQSPPKLAEYNADTPTVLVECAGAQRSWFRDFVAGEHQKLDISSVADPRLDSKSASQFNVLQESLEAAFRELKEDYVRSVGRPAAEERPLSLTFTTQGPSADSEFLEERSTTAYVRERAAAAGLSADMIDIEAFDEPAVFKSILEAGLLRGLGPPSVIIWKLYPYEWLVQEKLGLALINEEFLRGQVRWIEPAWKLILSSKAMLAYLWEKHPGHPNLAPSFYSFDHAEAESRNCANTLNFARDKWVAKPRFGREGVGIMYSDSYETWKDFREACLKSSNSKQLIPNFAPFQDSITKVGFSSGAGDNTQNSTSLGLGLDHFKRRLDRLLKENAMKTTGGTTTPLLDRDWGHKHVAESGTFGYHVGEPVVQAYAPPAELSGRSIVTSSWVVRGVPVAACFREDIARTTNDDSSFVPHHVLMDSNAKHTAPRSYPLSRQQRRLRAELYGSKPIERFHDTEELSSEPSDPAHLSYMNGGFAGCGKAPVGGGGSRPKPPKPLFSTWRESVDDKSSTFSGDSSSGSGWRNFRPFRGGTNAHSSETNRSGRRGQEAGKRASDRPVRANAYRARGQEGAGTRASDRPTKDNAHRTRGREGAGTRASDRPIRGNTYRTGTTSRGAAQAGRSYRS